MRRVFPVMLLSVAVGGCATVEGLTDRIGLGRDQAKVEAAPVDPFLPHTPAETTLAPETAAPPPPPGAQTAAALDTTTPEQRAAASAPAAPQDQKLGTTVASLGSPTEPGLWLKTPLVKAEQQGRVTNPANGKSSIVTLIPLDGPATGGSRLSLAAMRLIEASLTDLTEVEVSLVS